MIPNEHIRADLTETQENCDSAADRRFGADNEAYDAELMEDDAWLEACRKELHDDADVPSETADSRPDSLAMPHQMSGGGDNLATRSELSDPAVAIDKTGDDAMSKFGHAIGALAESDEDFDDQSLDYAAERAKPSLNKDEAVAPHIAAAERELETSRSSGASLDIFDRIAQAAESQFDESRGSTAKRVSELVDDRRVGTKRWTPSKTMKQRMEKLEAARAAAAGETVAPSSTGQAAAAGVAAAGAAAAVAASAPTSSTATMVTPNAKASAKDEAKADAELMAEEQRAAQAQTTVEDSAESTAAAVTESDAIEDDAADTLRIIPGARGRRRDRARKSRLDEDFEKVFDDDGKPSINSLRRKLRSTASAEAEAEAAGDVTASTGGEAVGGEADAQPKKKGLFSRLLQPKAKNAADQQAEAALGTEEDDLVAAFETSNQPLGDDTDMEALDGDALQASLDTERKQRRIAMPIIGIGALIGLVGVGWVAYRFLFG